MARPSFPPSRGALTLWAAITLMHMGCSSSGTATSPDEEASEEVNVGYGTLPEDRVTGAVSQIVPDEMPRSSAARLADLIAGRVAGVNVQRTGGNGYRVTIRGASSLYGSDEPLYVVDGVELMAPGLPDLNPNDVASISVLKDAGAAAIYGSRGANGVILITTRRGGR